MNWPRRESRYRNVISLIVTRSRNSILCRRSREAPAANQHHYQGATLIVWIIQALRCDISIMTPIGCWRYTGTPTQNEVVTVGKNETTPLHQDSLLGEFIHEAERESYKREYNTKFCFALVKFSVGQLCQYNQSLWLIRIASYKLINVYPYYFIMN